VPIEVPFGKSLKISPLREFAAGIVVGTMTVFLLLRPMENETDYLMILSLRHYEQMKALDLG